MKGLVIFKRVNFNIKMVIHCDNRQNHVFYKVINCVIMGSSI
jgi:hypothetical protein